MRGCRGARDKRAQGSGPRVQKAGGVVGGVAW